MMITNSRAAKFRVELMAAILLVVGFNTLQAQDLRGKVQGVVSDTTGAVIPGATVRLTNDNTNVETVHETNEVGAYLFDFVTPGTYSLTAETEGFRTFVQRNILVQTRADISVNPKMEVGAIAETVTVEEVPVAVSFNKTSTEMTLDSKMSQELPIIHRNPFLLAQLTAAVNYTGGSEQSSFHHWTASQMDVGGNTQNKNNILLDGVPQLVGAKGPTCPQWTLCQKSTCSRTRLMPSSATQPAELSLCR